MGRVDTISPLLLDTENRLDTGLGRFAAAVCRVCLFFDIRGDIAWLINASPSHHRRCVFSSGATIHSCPRYVQI
jgi:hypothetical protein